jgi:hypothetical protein
MRIATTTLIIMADSHSHSKRLISGGGMSGSSMPSVICSLPPAVHLHYDTLSDLDRAMLAKRLIATKAVDVRDEVVLLPLAQGKVGHAAMLGGDRCPQTIGGQTGGAGNAGEGREAIRRRLCHRPVDHVTRRAPSLGHLAPLLHILRSGKRWNENDNASEATKHVMVLKHYIDWQTSGFDHSRV